MALWLRQSCLYKGLIIEKHRLKVFLFADDTVIYLNGNPSQFKHVFDILRIFVTKPAAKLI